MNIKCLLILPVLFLFSGCEDFFEKDISEKRVELLVPADSVFTVRVCQTFVWDELEGASAYRLSVVSPAFTEPEVCLLDTLLSVCRFTFELEPGNYMWRVRAENSAWKSKPAERTLVVLPVK